MSILKKYLSHYSELSMSCWQNIFLTFIESLATGIYFFLSIYFVEILNFSIAISGLLISFYGIGTILGGILGGKLSDRYVSKIIPTFSLLIQSIVFVLLTLLQNKFLLMVDMFAMGVCSYVFMTSNNVWLIKQCKEKQELRLKVINISRAASNLGMGLAGVLIILLCAFLVNLIIAQLSVTYPVFIQKSFPEMGMKAISILFLLDTFLIVIFQTPLVSSLKNFNKIILIGVGSLLMGFGMFLLNYSHFFFMAIISCLIWTTGEMIFIGVAQFACYEFGLEKKKGQTLGLFQAVSASSRIIGPTLGGYIFYHFGSQPLWTISMLIGMCCFFLCCLFREYNNKFIPNSHELSFLNEAR